ncbi:MAG: hypothetical protein ACREVN_01120 [Gammaproteobacteria bacterium]
MRIQPTTRSRFTYLTLLVLPAAITAPMIAGAADGYVLPYASVESKYNDNWRLQPDDGGEQISALGTFIDLSAQLGARTQRSDISITPRLRSSFFTDSEDDDRLGTDDRFLDFNAFRDTEKARYAIAGGYSQESVLTSELDGVDFDDPAEDPGGTGDLNVDNERERIFARPSWTYDFSEQTQFGLAYQFADVSYDNQLENRQVDYTDHTLEASLARDLTERTLLTTRVFGGRFEADQNDNQTDSLGITFEFSRRLTERVTGLLLAGAERVEADFDDPVTGLPMETSDTNALFGAGLRSDLSETTSWLVDVTRSVNPNGTGFVVQRDEFRLGVDHAFGPRLSGSLGARAFRQEAVDENVRFNDRDYARLQGELRWALTETWSLFGAYQYTWQDREGVINPLTGMLASEGSASANAVIVGIAYQGRLRPGPVTMR